MFTGFNRYLTMLALLTVMAALEACTTANIASETTVAEAYTSPSALVIQPYNRTIFSSGNF